MIRNSVTSGGSIQGPSRCPVSGRRRENWRPWRTCLLVLLVVGTAGRTSAFSHAKHTWPVRIGALTDSWGPTPAIVGLRDGLVELGYRQDEDFFLGVRFTEGDRGALAGAARELVDAGVVLLFADSNTTAKAAQQAVSQIPIVFASVEDPVGSGLVRSFAQPGGNITGVASLDIELGPKRLQVFQQLVPGLKRVLFLYDATDVYSQAAAKLYQGAARRLGIAFVEKVVRSKEEVQTTLSHVHQHAVDGILVPRCCALNIPGFVLQATLLQLTPTMFNTNIYWIKRGALASYGSNTYDSGRQAARIVEKILKGGDPAKIPVEVNSTIEFTINLKTAKTLGITIAPNVLAQADRIVR